MSKRGNPDYWKTEGHTRKDPDLDELAKRRFGESRRVWLRGKARWLRPEPPLREVLPPPIREGELPWRVNLSPETLDERPPIRRSLALIGARLLARAVLAPLHAALSIAEALVERALWRLETQT